MGLTRQTLRRREQASLLRQLAQSAEEESAESTSKARKSGRVERGADSEGAE